MPISDSFKLEKEQSAIIFKEDGVEIILPEMPEEAIVPNHVQTSVLLMVLLKEDDQQLYDLLQRKNDELHEMEKRKGFRVIH